MNLQSGFSGTNTHQFCYSWFPSAPQPISRGFMTASRVNVNTAIQSGRNDQLFQEEVKVGGMSASNSQRNQMREHSFYWPAETPAEAEKETNNKPSDSSCSVAYKPLKSLLAFPGGAKRRARSLVLCKVGEES